MAAISSPHPITTWVRSLSPEVAASPRVAGPSTVVAVSRTRIDWLSYSTDRFQPVHKLNLSLPAAIACVPSSSPQEILAVCSDGFIARVAK